jgi:two-component system, NtrC family, response regulator
MILIVDDDASVIASLELLLQQQGFETRGVTTPEGALQEAMRPGVQLVIQDMNFSLSTTGEEGLALLSKIREQRPSLPVVLITAWGSISLAVEGMRRGAADFLTKPWSNAHVVGVVRTALSLADAQSNRREEPLTREALDSQFEFSAIVGRDPKLLNVLQLIGRVAETDASVLIMGPSGTGKELIAEAIHRNSRRRGGPFVKVNLGGISSTLFESEMFGHVRGAFTDARENRKGRFEVADGGTIFLDEIGEVDLNAQVKLLRVLQDRTYEVLGSSRTKNVDLRVVSATNQNLPDLVRDGRFREDLLYRLNLITIHVPALAERRGDIPLLVDHFIRGFAQSYGRAKLAVSREAMEWLRAQPWPGNIRQLRQVIERAVLISRSDELVVGDFKALSELQAAAASESSTLPAVGSMTLDEMEKAMIAKCMAHYEGNVSRVAEALGLSRAALYRRFEKYGLETHQS